MGAFKNAAGKPVLMRMVKGIQDNKAYLGEVDGLIGDGDHGMNMNKGFSVFEERFKDEDISFSEGLDELGMILLNEIGGSMGPIYGTIFMDMAEAGEDLDEITAADLGAMLEAGLNGLYGIVDAKVGDKTLVDTLAPSVDVMKAAGAEGKDFKEALAEMIVLQPHFRMHPADVRLGMLHPFACRGIIQHDLSCADTTIAIHLPEYGSTSPFP